MVKQLIDTFRNKKRHESELIWNKAERELKDALSDLRATTKQLQSINDEHEIIYQRMLDALRN